MEDVEDVLGKIKRNKQKKKQKNKRTKEQKNKKQNTKYAYKNKKQIRKKLLYDIYFFVPFYTVTTRTIRRIPENSGEGVYCG